jgi:hypothetical protein
LLEVESGRQLPDPIFAQKFVCCPSWLVHGFFVLQQISCLNVFLKEKPLLSFLLENTETNKETHLHPHCIVDDCSLGRTKAAEVGDFSSLEEKNGYLGMNSHHSSARFRPNWVVVSLANGV